MTPRPQALDVCADTVPTALGQERRWACWRYELGHGRWAKVPRQTTGAYARPNDPATWTTFEDALAAYRSGRFDGIGFCLGDGWAGIDLDNVADAPSAFLDGIPCYREVSPSGHGLKAIGRARRTGGEFKFLPDALPIRTPWSGARYFAITGHGTGDPTIDITDIIDEWFPLRSWSPLAERPAFIQQGDTRGTENIGQGDVYARLSDDEVVARILESAQAERFTRLVRGDLSDYDWDHSRADQALCSILAYWCQRDVEQIDRLFRQSGLMRDKWSSASYRRATLTKAVRP